MVLAANAPAAIYGNARLILSEGRAIHIMVAFDLEDALQWDSPIEADGIHRGQGIHDNRNGQRV
jgi:hypothetical protein